MRTVRFLILMSSLLSTLAFGWGERGHDIVTRVAVRILMHDSSQHEALINPFAAKEHMLAHLSNIPDMHWRNVKGIGEKAVKYNGPTHFVDIEYLAPAATYADFPQSVSEAEAKMKKLCETKEASYVCPASGKTSPKIWQAGSAPWRIAQLTTAMSQAFQQAKIAQNKKDVVATETAINQALLLGGLVSHFVGDLGNPHHTTRDYDGWESGQGGFHTYFETSVLNTYDLSLDQEVLDWAIENRPASRLAEIFPKTYTSPPKAFDLAVALTLDSFNRRNTLSHIDRTHALEKESKDVGGLKIKAERKKPAAVQKHFRPIIVERLSTAADTLSRLWKMAWINGGRPDLSGYQSYEYPLAPDFIELNY